jgi:hypothetical protein
MAVQDVIVNMQVQGNAAQQTQRLADQARVIQREFAEATNRINQAAQAATQQGNFADVALAQTASKQLSRAEANAQSRLVRQAALAQPFDPLEVALERQRRDQQQLEVRRSLNQLDPDRYKDPDAAAGGGRGNLLGGTGLERIARPLFLIHALSSEAEAMGRTLEKVGTDTDRARHAHEALAQHMAESIPLVGGLARGFVSLLDAASGLSASREGGLEAVANARRQLTFAGGEQSVRFGAGQEQAALARAAADAQTRSGVSAEQLRRFQTDAALRESFRPEVRPFVANEQTGPLRFAEFTAQGQLSAASRILTARSAEAVAARQTVGADQLQERIAEQERATRAADRRQREAERSFEQRPGYGSALLSGAAAGRTFGIGGLIQAGAVYDERARREKELNKATSDFSRQNLALQSLREQQQERFNALKESEVRLSQAAADKAQAAYSLEESRVNVARNQVGLRQQEFNAAQNRSEFFGTAGRGEQLAALEAARRLNEGAQLRDLPPQLQGLVRQLAPDQFRERARQEGQGPELAEFNRLLGVKPQGEAGDALKRATDILNEAQLKADAALKTALAATDEAKAQRLAEIINASMDNRIALLAAKLRDQQGVAKQKQ